ncbi:MAG: PAS domain-containing protein [Chloroflexi bacterium]|nr:PAS domain-containing protein [Chloroflexota bacterium]
MVTKVQLTSQHVVDSLPHSILVFDSADRLVMANQAAKALMGTDLRLIQAEGWTAAQVLFNARPVDQIKPIDEIRRSVLNGGDPARFYIYRSAERLPCWLSGLNDGDERYTLVAVDRPDWSAMNDVLEKYLEEVRDVMLSTKGHTDLIVQSIAKAKPGTTAEQISGRVAGFAKLIDIHMFRLQALTAMIERLDHLRTGVLREQVGGSRRKIVLSEYMEDFLESLDEIQLVDPESDQGDYRKRIQAIVPPKLTVMASPASPDHCLARHSTECYYVQYAWAAHQGDRLRQPGRLGSDRHRRRGLRDPAGRTRAGVRAVYASAATADYGRVRLRFGPVSG